MPGGRTDRPGDPLAPESRPVGRRSTRRLPHRSGSGRLAHRSPREPAGGRRLGVVARDRGVRPRPPPGPASAHRSRHRCSAPGPGPPGSRAPSASECRRRGRPSALAVADDRGRDRARRERDRVGRRDVRHPRTRVPAAPHHRTSGARPVGGASSTSPPRAHGVGPRRRRGWRRELDGGAVRPRRPAPARPPGRRATALDYARPSRTTRGRLSRAAGPGRVGRAAGSRRSRGEGQGRAA